MLDRDTWLRSQRGWIPIEGRVLSEVMASTSTTIADEHGDYDDWIEVADVGTSSIDPAGLSLADHMDGTEPFLFPAATLDPGEDGASS